MRVTTNPAVDGGGDLDAVLLVPRDAPRRRSAYTALLVAEGYRVAVAHDVETGLASAVASGAAVVFVPSLARGRDLVALREALCPFRAIDVPVVILGNGWTTRLRESERHTPFSDGELSAGDVASSATTVSPATLKTWARDGDDEPTGRPLVADTPVPA